jgi:uncharacterized protein (DUF1015 family)
MVAVIGLKGLRPSPDHVGDVTCPPYDVIRPGTPLGDKLANNPRSLFHVTLGDTPKASLDKLQGDGSLVADDENAFYVYEQSWGDGQQRTGVFLAAAVSPYSDKQIIRHEKTFDDKVKGRIQLRRDTEHSFGPVWVLTKAPLSAALDAAKKSGDPLYTFTSDLHESSDLHGIANRVWRIPEDSDEGRAIQAALADHPLYIADGHHRYHASLLNEQTHFLCYVAAEGEILAYNRVVRGKKTLDEVKDQHALEPADWATPEKNAFTLYTRDGTFKLKAKEVPSDVVGRLDCAILERELYPSLGLSHDMIMDPAHFDYYPESALGTMKARVDAGDYDIAIALHPVALEELMSVADAGLEDPEIVMPEKSTFFAPKILTGLFVYRHETK